MLDRIWDTGDVYDFSFYLENHGGKVIEVQANMSGFTFIVSGIPYCELLELMTVFDSQRSK